MYQIDLNSKIHVHFIGIGGISMSGLAEILLNRGFTVSGSDGKASPLTDSLAGKGCKIAIGQKAENITDDIDLVVYTAAIHKDNPEFAEAVNRKLPMLTRAELLGQIMKGFPLSVAVAGTHGKTTTTSMLTSILLAADADPTISVGGMLKEIGGNIRIGNSDYFVTEACEYTNSFLSLFPKIAVILNIEEDHLDFFEDLRDIRNSFQKFAGLLPEDGVLILHSGIDQPDEIIKATPKGASVLTFGLPDAGPENAFPCYSCKDISFDSAGCASYTLLEKDEEAGRIKLSVPGE
ncbi:MAG: UDP-N-acetylmuramate--L-alanine ligase, partial [Lachnospiraceae bacterium]|nr:UDP-N-acetylmuramate--L-alanine ligase [Lachnospiraceae bacterium]